MNFFDLSGHRQQPPHGDVISKCVNSPEPRELVYACSGVRNPSLARLHEVHRAIVVTSVVSVYVYVYVRVRVTLSVKVFEIVIS